MSTSFGQNTLGTVGLNLTARTNPAISHNKPGGITIDWSKVATNSGGATSLGGTSVPAGVKYIEVGTIMARVTASGKYAPADTSASDGRETVTNAVRGERFVLDRLLLESEPHSEQVGDVFDEGDVFKSRIQMGGTNQPTEANVETMLPKITFITD